MKIEEMTANEYKAYRQGRRELFIELLDTTRDRKEKDFLCHLLNRVPGDALLTDAVKKPEPKRLFEDVLSEKAQKDLDNTVLEDLQGVMEALKEEVPELFDPNSPIQLKELRVESKQGQVLTREQVESGSFSVKPEPYTGAFTKKHSTVMDDVLRSLPEEEWARYRSGKEVEEGFRQGALVYTEKGTKVFR